MLHSWQRRRIDGIGVVSYWAKRLPHTFWPCGSQLSLVCPIFGRPFVKRFALCHRTVVCLSVYPVLSCPVCGVGVLLPNGWTDRLDGARWFFASNLTCSCPNILAFIGLVYFVRNNVMQQYRPKRFKRNHAKSKHVVNVLTYDSSENGSKVIH